MSAVSFAKHFSVDICCIKFNYLLIFGLKPEVAELNLSRRNEVTNQKQKIPAKKLNRQIDRYNRPFWLPASNYYILSVAVSLVFFFLIWGVLLDDNDELPLIVAGLSACIVLSGAVFLREFVLKKARNKFLVAQNQLDKSLNNISVPRGSNFGESKLTLEINAEFINRIRYKSEAAKTLKKLPNAHLEVFESCNEYLALSRRALETVNSASPRFTALRRGREVVKQLHKYHLLSWAGLESRFLTQEAKNQIKISEKLKNAQKAQTILETALHYYPEETQLVESDKILREFVASIKISHWIEQAERARFKENYKRAISCYRDALFFMARENIQNEDRRLIAEKINQEIETVRRLANKTQNVKNIRQTKDLENEKTND